MARISEAKSIINAIGSSFRLTNFSKAFPNKSIPAAALPSSGVNPICCNNLSILTAGKSGVCKP
ncbi:hypothetical protein B6D19_07430 [Gilliamella apicola]|uniref:hypothetical protein n=1 Tax=Gilliamella apicola TaxID=1196095 RepID=UPI000A35B577|nr:hypothetical protein [Gilliamella apicola]OTQ31967.1 hypothetical protein B6D19_07430 [Gilliamella apicola]OTQ45721.1 hypothetical protein B6D20_03770 [Gilliamella apicola]